MKIAILHTRLRTEERLLLEAAEQLGITAEPIDLREVTFSLDEAGRWSEFDVVLDRSLSLTSSLTAVRMLELHGVRCINRAATIEMCSDKLVTSIALAKAALPTPGVRVATSPEAALEAIEAMGYPVVLKPTIGSWGRLLARINDRDAAEAVLEHRATLGSVQHSVFYIQEYIDKPGRDIRVFVIGGKAIAAIARSSEHWVTNTARGAVATGLEVSPELAELAERSAAVVQADIVAVDLLECPRRGLLISELNHSMEFRNSIDVTGVNIPKLLIEHAATVARDRTASPRPPVAEGVTA